MSKEQIKIAYDGEALQDGGMDVRELAPALLSLGALCERANEVLNGDQAKLFVKVKSDFKKGSFEVIIELWQSAPAQVKSFITGQGITKANEILKLLGYLATGTATTAFSLIKLIKWLKGRKPDNASILENGNIRIEIKNNKHIEIHQKVYNLYNDADVRKNLKNTLNPLQKEGIDVFETRQDSKVIETISKKEIEYFTIHEPQEELVLDTSTEAIYRIIKPSFNPELKWNLISLDGAKIAAEMKDYEFLEKIQSGQLSFKNGDILKINLHSKVWQTTEGGYRSEHIVLKVIEHKHTNVSQLKLFNPPEAISND